MAQDAELKLKVSLDLAFFRQQISTIGTQLGGQAIQLNIKFDKKSISDQYRLLDSTLSRKTFKVKIESPSLDTLAAKVATFKEGLQKLEKEDIKLNVDIESKIKGQDAADARRNLIASITGPKGAVFIPIEVKPPLVKNINAIRKDIKERLSGIIVEIDAKVRNITGAPSPGQGRGRSPGFETARKDIAGLTVEQLRSRAFKSLGEESRSAQQVSNWLDQIVQQGIKGADKTKQLNAVRDFLADALVKSAGSNIQARLQPIRGQRQTSAPRSMSNLNEMLDRMANLTENPRAAQRMLRMIPESRITTDLVGAANRQAEFRQEGLKFLDLKGKAFDPLFDAIAESFTNYTRSVNSSNPWVGKIGTGITQLISRALTQSPEQMFGGRAPIAGAKLLPAAGQSSASRMMRTAFSGLPAITSPQIGGENAPLSRAASYMVNKARRALGMPIGPASPYAPSPFAGAATVPPRSFFRFGQGPQLPGAPIQAALPPAGTTTNYGGGGFFGYGGVTGSGGGGGGGRGGRGGALAFPGGNMGPSSPLPKNYLEIGKAIKSLDPILQKRSVPFSGAIRELGQEFGFAIKQVLLFGTAYKALAFFTDLPAQALNASRELQSFNNQLNAITGSSSNAQRSVQFINDTVAQFNIPLQSAREGFLRLYASMSPAGMEADTIENLFVGISQASATLGLSADQVDRVTYAFSQMASKGKVMSEEVTGQLGDVIPGALSLMADAAGMSMAEFKDAMEAGQVSGKAMEQLFTNLPIVMEQRFGKGAVGAAKTLQGQLNDLATTTQRMYESFEPLVTSIANQILPAVSTAMKDTQSAVEAFGLKIQGINPATNLLSENAQALYKNFEIVADTASSAAVIIQSLGGVFGALGNIVSGALQIFNALVANPVGEFFVKLAVNIGIATAAINLFAKSGIIAAIKQLVLLVGNIKLTIGALRTLITTSRAAKIAVGGIVAGTIMVGLEMLVTHLSKVRQETDKLKNSALLAADALNQMTFQQLVAQEATVKKMIQNIERLQAAAGGGLKITRPTPEQEAMARELGLSVTGRAGQRAINMTRAEGMRQQLLEQLPQIRGAMDRKFAAPATAAITPIDLAAGEEDKTKKARKNLRDLVSSQILMLAEAEKAAIKLSKAQTEALAPDTAQSKRILDYYVEFRNNIVDIQAIQAQLAIAEKNRGKFISEYGMTAEEIDGNIIELRNQLKIATIDLAATEQKYRNRAKTDAADEAAEIQEKIDKQKELNRLVEDAKIAAGIIPPQQAAIIQQQRGFEDARARIEAGGTPEQLAQLTAAQALIPQAGSIQEYIKGLREELQQLISVQNLAAVSARGIGEALGEAMTNGVASLISGTATAKEVFASFLQSVGQALSQAASQMIATYIAIGIARIFAGLGGGGGGADYSSGKVATGAFNTDSLGMGPSLSNWNWQGAGFTPFANGGVVTGPTLGLIGEGKYNEAVVPLPDGKSIPVSMDATGIASATSKMIMERYRPTGSAAIAADGGGAMSAGGEGGSVSSGINVNYDVIAINSMRFVTEDQFQQGITAAAAEGAKRGERNTLQSLQRYRSVRSKVGLR